jgi:Cys-rich four helix bundle protein (predicted Tat secretion target)
MDRREILIGAGAIAAVTAAQAAFAAEKPAAQSHDHQHHHGKAKYQSLVDSAAHCVATGEVCLDHCVDVLQEGDKTMADCARSVNELIAVCAALRSLAAQDASGLKAMAKVALDSCKRCEDECRKHEKKHQACKDCGDACAQCAKECKKLVG